MVVMDSYSFAFPSLICGVTIDFLGETVVTAVMMEAADRSLSLYISVALCRLVGNEKCIIHLGFG